MSEPPALIGMVASLVVMLYVRFYTPLAWTWYVLLGSGVTLLVAWLAGLFLYCWLRRKDKPPPCVKPLPDDDDDWGR